MQTPDSITLILKEASRGLLYQSESDYPFDVLVISLDTNMPLTAETLPALLNISSSATIEQTDLESFLRPMSHPHDPHDKVLQQEAPKYRQLEKVLQSELHNTQVFRVGEIKIDVYILGYTKEGNLAGLHTTVIET